MRLSYAGPQYHRKFFGKKQCYVCGEKLEGRRTAYCSDNCRVEMYLLLDKTNWNKIRVKAKERDNHKCVRCNDGINTITEPLEVDHIIPVSMGGAEFDLKNMQTLCNRCHKEKTKEDKAKIKAFKKIRDGQKTL